MVRVGNDTLAWHAGMTLAGLLETVADGHLYAVVRLNGKLVSRPHFEGTLVPDNAEVTLIPMIAGG